LSNGVSSEILFDYEAIQRGFIISRPVSDTHYDRLLDNGDKIIRVQIKSTAHKKRNRWHVKAHSKVYGSYELYGNRVDVIAIHIKPENVWVFYMSSDIKVKDLYVSTKTSNNWNIFDAKEDQAKAIRMHYPLRDNEELRQRGDKTG